MATDLSFFARTNLPDCNGTPGCQQTTVCPSCGGLECLCRPRFFAGQLLTEDDLNRLDNYIVAKNRLHNRYLVGWGVACGLEVVCNVCGPDQASGSVLVKPGYALSPCGNDIVVCNSESVDVCALVNASRPAQDGDCADMFTSPQANSKPSKSTADSIVGVWGSGNTTSCDGGTEDWILAVCYSEKPARGMTALLRANTASAAGGCGCGGSGGSGCSCGSSGSGGNGATTKKSGCGCAGSSAAPNANSASALPDQCEPTMTCEGYRFVAYKAPKPGAANQRRYGDAAKRFLCCILPLFEELGTAPHYTSGEKQKAIDWVYALRDTVREFIVNEGFYDCQIAARFAAVSVPSASTASDKMLTSLNESASGYVSVGLLALQKCLCAALLPPCPDPAQLDCVPIATVSVARGAQCRVLKVCNLAARKFLVTIPNIAYWLSFFNIFGNSKYAAGPFGHLLELLCCSPPDAQQRGTYDILQTAEQLAASAKKSAADDTAAEGLQTATKATGNAFASILAKALANPDRHVGVQNLMLAALGATDADGQPYATREEMANPTEFLLLNQLVAPMIRQLVPADGGKLLQGATTAGSDESTRIDDLARELHTLKSKVAEQQKTIAALKKRK